MHEVIADLVPRDSYFRLNPSGDAFACELDETDQVGEQLIYDPGMTSFTYHIKQVKLQEMQMAAQRYIEKNIHHIHNLCAHLMSGIEDD